MAKRDLKQSKELQRGGPDSLPDMKELREKFLWCVQRRDSTVFRRQKLNFNTRNCIWPNQSLDGRKWKSPHGDVPFPWEGASDARVPLADMYINQDISLLMVTWRRMKTLVTGTEINDAAFANRLTQVLRWMKYTQMKEAKREMRLCANYMLERGVGVIGTFWERRTQLAYEEIDLEDIKNISEQAQQAMAQATSVAATSPGGGGMGMMGGMDGGGNLQQLVDLPQIIMSPAYEDEAIEIAGQRFPDVAESALRKAIRELRTTGSTKIATPYLVRNRPTIVALAPNEEIFIPPEATELSTAAESHRREMVTETTLRDRAYTMGWDKGWVEEFIATGRGKVTADFDGNMFYRVQRVNATGVMNTERLYEVVQSCERKADENGVSGLYYTCWSPHMLSNGRGETTVAWHGLLDYQHGEQPYTIFEREVRGRLLDDSRGVGEIASTWQAQIKTEWDSRVDLSSIATLPPSYHPSGQAPDKWGPGVQIPTDRPDDYGFMEVPNSNGRLSAEVQENVREFADEYFGRSRDPEKQVIMGIVKQDVVDNWLDGCAAVDTHMLQLMQQYMPESFYYRVVGSNKGKSIHTTREEIQGKFDCTVGFNAKSLDPEEVEKEFDLLERTLQMDTSGRIDRDEALQVCFDMLDPNLGERLLKPGEEASQHEIDDEQAAFAKIWSGLQVDIRPGQAYQMRLQWLRNMLQQNPAAMARAQKDKQFVENVKRRMDQMQFQIDQRENAITGKFLGTQLSAQHPAPSLGD